MARWQVPVVLGAVTAGLALGLSVPVDDPLEGLVLPALAALLTLTFAAIRPGSFTETVRPHRRTAAASLGLNFVWAPAAAGLLGWLFLSGNPDLRIGLVMLLVTPCTDWYLVFIATARGNVALGAALLPVNLVLQLALLPVFVVVLTGATADIPVRELVLSVIAVLGIPLAVAVAVRNVASHLGSSQRLDALLTRSGPLGGRCERGGGTTGPDRRDPSAAAMPVNDVWHQSSTRRRGRSPRLPPRTNVLTRV